MSSTLMLLPLDLSAPIIHYRLLVPILIIFGAACVGVLIEALVPRSLRRSAQLVITFVAIAGGLISTLWNWRFGSDTLTAVGSLALDGPTYFMWTILLIFSAVSIMMFAERKIEVGVSAFAASASAVPGTLAEREAIAARSEHTEVFPLALFALCGMMIFPASNDLITMFVALEILSLPLYLLCGLARKRRLLSQEAALKYFLLGALSSAFYIYGAALLYGYSGSFTLSAIDDALRNSVQPTGLLLAGMGLLGVGLLFKFGAVPFHSWTPDVYSGAPTPVTGFMAACTKIAAIGALMRVFYVGLGGDRWDWQPLMAIVAILTMAVGSVLAITQTDVKRMLAYSSIAHAGFVLVGFVGVYAGTGAGVTSLSSVLFYLTAYGFSTIGAFAVVTLVRDAGGETTALSRWAGLGREAPVLAGTFAFFLLAFAGIPLTSGFIGKWTVFAAAWAGGAWPLVVVAVVTSAVAAFFYVRVIVAMFFADPVGSAPAVAVPSVLTTAVIAVTALATVALGVVPGPVLELAQQAGAFIR